MFNHYQRGYHLSQAGFTLLELMVVLFLTVTLAVSMMDIIQYEDNQNRMDLTRVRLDALRQATVGQDTFLSWAQSSPVFNNGTQNGYFVENGVWPSGPSDLENRPVNAAEFMLLNAIFDQTPHSQASCTDLDNLTSNIGRVDDAGATPDLYSVVSTGNNSTLILAKGHRGAYLPAQINGGNFLDGWGNTFDVNKASDAITFSSFGSDGSPGISSVPLGEANYTGDLNLTLQSADYKQTIDQWRVTLSNLPPSSEWASFGSGAKLGMAILLFENTNSDANQNWRRINVKSGVAIDNPEWLSSGTSSMEFQASTTNVGENYNHACRTWIPVGRHLLVIYSDEDGSPFQGHDEVPRYAALFDVYPRQSVVMPEWHLDLANAAVQTSDSPM